MALLQECPGPFQYGGHTTCGIACAQGGMRTAIVMGEQEQGLSRPGTFYTGQDIGGFAKIAPIASGITLMGKGFQSKFFQFRANIIAYLVMCGETNGMGYAGHLLYMDQGPIRSE